MAVSPEATRAAQALEDLYREHAAEVYRYAYRTLGNRADAEDMTQATFMNALRAMERGERPRTPGNWLIRIAHNVARERFRRAQSRPTEVAFDVDLATAKARDDDEQPSVHELLAALGRIPAAQRSALVMREFEGRPYAEIAKTLEITTSALETLLFRARRSVAEELENVVTCERAEQELVRLKAGTLGRKERRRLEEHLSACPSCDRLRTDLPKRARVLGGLAWLPFPFSFKLFHGSHSPVAAAASAAPATAAGAAAGTAGSTLALSGGLAAKVAAIAVAATVTGGVGYVGVDQVRLHQTRRPAPTPAAVKARGAISTSTSVGRAAAAKRRLGHPSQAARGVASRRQASTVRRNGVSTKPARTVGARPTTTGKPVVPNAESSAKTTPVRRSEPPGSKPSDRPSGGIKAHDPPAKASTAPPASPQSDSFGAGSDSTNSSRSAHR